VIAFDLERWLEHHPSYALCLVLDGFERIQSTNLAEDIQKFLADWCGLLTDPDATFAGRFGCVFLGRNMNRWDDLYDNEWRNGSVNTASAGWEKKRCEAEQIRRTRVLRGVAPDAPIHPRPGGRFGVDHVPRSFA
jgi:hypothetical protein